MDLHMARERPRTSIRDSFKQMVYQVLTVLLAVDFIPVRYPVLIRFIANMLLSNRGRGLFVH